MIFPRRRNNVKCIRSTPLQERVQLTSSVEVLIIVPGSGQPKQKIPILLLHKLISLSFFTLRSPFFCVHLQGLLLICIKLLRWRRDEQSQTITVLDSQTNRMARNTS